jgi:hypothetical protein
MIPPPIDDSTEMARTPMELSICDCDSRDECSESAPSLAKIAAPKEQKLNRHRSHKQ